jgi:anti-sigma factor RsiW
MHCIASQHHIHALVDECLTEAACRRVTEHLAECPACRRLAADLRTINATLCRLAQATPVPHDLLDTCRRRLHDLVHELQR